MPYNVLAFSESLKYIFELPLTKSDLMCMHKVKAQFPCPHPAPKVLYEKWSTLKAKNLLPKGTDSSVLKKTPFQNEENLLTVISLESVSISCKVPFPVMACFSSVQY